MRHDKVSIVTVKQDYAETDIFSIPSQHDEGYH